MRVIEKEIHLQKPKDSELFFESIIKNGRDLLSSKTNFPLKLVITDNKSSQYKCEVSLIESEIIEYLVEMESIFDFRKRLFKNEKQFNTVFLIPTGIGCEFGGHAGDSTPVAKMIASVCDTLISHPNVFNGSDIIEKPENALYVEGSSICRLLMGTAALQPVKQNKILVLVDSNAPSFSQNTTINSVNAARSILGVDCFQIIKLPSSLSITAEYSPSKRAVGLIDNLDSLFDFLTQTETLYEAIAVSSFIKTPKGYYRKYFESGGSMVNPWGGAEAMLTHALSFKFNVPSAHAPMFISKDILSLDMGVVDSRMAAEVISKSFFYSVLKGLHKSPKIITNKSLFFMDDIISVEDISCLVIPDGILSLTVLAALKQGIKVIAVKENNNLMKNDLSALPWRDGQFFYAETYLEAVGVLTSLKEGININAIRRPFETKILT